MRYGRLQCVLAGRTEALVLALLLAGSTAGLAAQKPSPGAAMPPAGPREARQAPEKPQASASQSKQEIRVRSNLVATPVTVLDNRGEMVYGLRKQDFQVFDNGVPQKIQSLGVSSRPLAVVILIQANDAVRPLLKQLSPLAPLFTDLLLGPKGRAAVMSYSNRINELQDFSSSPETLATTLKNLTARGGQARLNDAMARAIAQLAHRPTSERRILLVFSDGSDSGSETSEQDVIQRAARAGVSVYGLGFSRTMALLKSATKAPAPDPADANVARSLPPNTIATPSAAESTYGTPVQGVPLLDAAGRLLGSALHHHGPLEAYAAYTGGVFYQHKSERALQDQLSRIADEIHSQYELAYVPNDLNQSGFHHIRVQVERPGVKVRARAGYYYPWLAP